MSEPGFRTTRSLADVWVKIALLRWRLNRERPAVVTTDQPERTAERAALRIVR